MSATLEPTYADGTRVCGIADALEVVGDRWSILVVREIGFGNRRFDGIQRLTGAPRQILTRRLRKLEDVGVVERRAYQERPVRHEYDLTRSGVALLPILGTLREWGEEFAPPRRTDVVPPADDPTAAG